MTILVKFPLGTFNTSNLLNYDFNYYYEMAEEGATKYSNNSTNVFVTILALLFFIVLPFIFLIIGIFSFSTKDNSKLVFGKNGNRVPDDIPLFRDIPCKKDIFRAYFIAYI